MAIKENHKTRKVDFNADDYFNSIKAKVINELEDEVWYIESNQPHYPKALKINWSKIPEPYYLKEYIQALVSDGNQVDGRIIFSTKAITLLIGVHSRFHEIKNTLYPDLEMSKITFIELKAIFKTFVLKDNTPLIGRFNKLRQYLNHLSNFSREGSISVGKVDVFIDEEALFHFMEDCFDNKKAFAEWRKGGSWDVLPAVVGIKLFSDMLEVIENDKCKFILGLFQYYRENKEHQLLLLSHDHGVCYNANRKKRKARPLIYYAFKKIENINYTLPHFWSNYHNSYQEFLIGLARLYKKYGYNVETIPSVEERTKWCEIIYGAVAIITGISTGIRISELSSIKANSFIEDRKGNVFFESKVYKTHEGFKIKRSMSKKTKNTLEILKKISFELKVGNTSLWEPSYQRRYSYGRSVKYCDGARVPLGTLPSDFESGTRSLRKLIQNSYNFWYSQQTESIKSISPHKLPPHAMRHAFVACCLRVYGGNILPNIKRHLLHHSYSTYTQTYISGKGDEELRLHVEKEYFDEIIDSIVFSWTSGENREWIGQVANTIEKVLKTNHKILSTKEFEKEIENIKGQFIHIKPHPIGICVPRKDSVHLSKCFDRESNSPLYHERGRPKNCINCINFITNVRSIDELKTSAIAIHSIVNHSVIPAVTDELVPIEQKLIQLIKEAESINV